MAIFKKLTCFSAIAILFFAGCRSDESIGKIRAFANNTWERFDYVTFDFPIENEKDAYNIHLLLRYNERFTSEALLINFVMTMPSGEERIRDYRINMKEKDGTLSGEEKAGYHEKLITIREGMRIGQAGNLNIEIENLMPKYYTPGIVEVGIILEPYKE